MFDWLGDFFSTIFGGLAKAILDFLNGILGGIVSFFSRIVDSLSGILGLLDSFKEGISGLYAGFLSLLSAVFPFFPPEWTSVMMTCILMTVVGIIIKRRFFE